jgi:hypothetical protein
MILLWGGIHVMEHTQVGTSGGEMEVVMIEVRKRCQDAKTGLAFPLSIPCVALSVSLHSPGLTCGASIIPKKFLGTIDLPLIFISTADDHCFVRLNRDLRSFSSQPFDSSACKHEVQPHIGPGGRILHRGSSRTQHPTAGAFEGMFSRRTTQWRQDDCHIPSWRPRVWRIRQPGHRLLCKRPPAPSRGYGLNVSSLHPP